jgi:hypothetical protein
LSIGLQTAKDGEHVVLAIVVYQLFAVAYDVGMTGGTLLIRTLTQSVFHGRRLRGQLRKRSRSNGQH